MGMAAAQGRFLGLTARKTNVEFQGQQINQQRTVLSNQNANYNTQLLSLKPPKQPNAADYTKTVYTFTDYAGKTNTIDSMAANADGLTYTLNVSFTKSSPGIGYKDEKSSIVTRTNISTDPLKTDYKYTIGNADLYALDATKDKSQIEQLQKAYAEAHDLDPKDAKVTGMVFYGVDTDAKSGYDSYYTKADVEDTAGYSDSTVDSKKSAKTIDKYMIGTIDETLTNTIEDAKITTDSTSGRLMAIKFDNKTYNISTTKATDDAAYENAQNQYQYEQAQYDKTMIDINAKLAVVQQQDKTLELKLKQLDTEQDAISNEMDAVKKVIDKNVESTFKTFG